MGIGRFLTLDVKASAAPGDPAFVANLDGITIQTFGTFSATLYVQVSHDGMNWFDHPDVPAITGAEVHLVPGTWHSLRVNTTVFTSGTPEATLGGRDTRTR